MTVEISVKIIKMSRFLAIVVVLEYISYVLAALQREPRFYTVVI